MRYDLAAICAVFGAVLVAAMLLGYVAIAVALTVLLFIVAIFALVIAGEVNFEVR